MYSKKLVENIENELEALKGAGKFKVERELEGAQGAEVNIAGKKVLMFASNNYLGLANHPEIIKASKEAVDKYGFGLSSVRFIAGTETIHKTLEKKLAEFLGTEDAILYSTNFMANLGFFATMTNEAFGDETSHLDAIYSDELNHASIIDAFKLCKKENVVKRIYPHGDIPTLEQMLEEDKSKNYRFKIIVTDGVFSMEGYLANLPEIKKLAEKYEALLFVDDAHAVGVLGKTGAGTPEYYDLHGKIDILSGTFGKALGGAIGGYIAGKAEIVELLRQKSRTYLFSNSLPPSVVMASIKALDLLKEELELLNKVIENSEYFREEVKKLGFNVLEGNHPIVPVMLSDAGLTQKVSRKLLDNGLYVVGLWFPVVPEGAARLRFQISAAHTKGQIDQAIEIMREVGKEMKII
ncbi:glycine C-acetyltransferase [Candidatus Nomurabacteria bacterium RIFCSPLOWO2_02_40_28]|uniref:2-amino-3-ketobutyrate coenzyme A ligase n=2 Tax=Candidatus Nomuraibacteriota TaxID=1752729 RepID=A0A837HX30_9BACT|nr:MAG: 2-amino-3-ketobutyrate coenzyme A ligase [Candidatus Nomurabacteria bacterium GW2011_GWD2_39_12]KKR20992.1 MAG: 2-amino-3-ketobutyrate coenzyme A ligase [Candidatus Nomurabacteria bacterium GW2011_GWC2_39_41]KKR36994.1 MAG: 2-amino-3-ketobutyrate coenzyme A ligase [Candidatus Nomurabacteria bacterium GW2011_GWE2_40_10]KKR38941.1 MAG: 2-amino-3-ketobutyrate coenzyme A ligase [Candidatus Nomurabacteria bacterium GW2011_GWB1_40_11]KKR40183.1 MAG: 2-amino-3-ketobutyrate coenzyme A ligase [P